jgi:hypothetical protein
MRRWDSRKDRGSVKEEFGLTGIASLHQIAPYCTSRPEFSAPVKDEIREAADFG